MATSAQLSELNKRFLQDLVVASKLSSNVMSITPSILFLSSTLVLLFQHFHRYTTFYTRWKTRLYKDLLLHWSYFYTTRVWFLFLKLMKYFLHATSNIVNANNLEDDAKFINNLLYFSVFFLVLIISFIPVLILVAQHIYRRHIPNFLMWVGEDPWIRSEMGTSGHYLERPPVRVITPKVTRQNASYRSRRSSSVDNTLSFSKEQSDFRPCKSMITVNPCSVNDLCSQ